MHFCLNNILLPRPVPAPALQGEGNYVNSQEAGQVRPLSLRFVLVWRRQHEGRTDRRSQRDRLQYWSCTFIICDESSPLLNGLISILKGYRNSHRAVTLHGDTAGSRGVCSLLLDSSRKTRNRIYGCLIEAVPLWSLINPHLFSIDWFPSLKITGWSIEWSLFMETQLGPGESALCCWILLGKQEPGFLSVW